MFHIQRILLHIENIPINEGIRYSSKEVLGFLHTGSIKRTILGRGLRQKTRTMLKGVICLLLLLEMSRSQVPVPPGIMAQTVCNFGADAFPFVHLWTFE